MFEIGWTIIEKLRQNMTQNEHAYAICYQPEVDDDVIFSQNVKTIKGYNVVNFEVASSSSFRDFPKR